MSITVANTAPGMVVLTAGIAIAQRVTQGEWGWTWMAYFWGGILAFSIIGSAIAGIFAGVGHLLGGDKRARDARLVRYEGFHIHICDPQKSPPGVGRLTIVPELQLIEVDPLPAPIRETVDRIIQQLRRDVASSDWIAKLPGELAPLGERGYEVREPTTAWHWHDPGPSSPPPPSAT